MGNHISSNDTRNIICAPGTTDAFPGTIFKYDDNGFTPVEHQLPKELSPSLPDRFGRNCTKLWNTIKSFVPDSKEWNELNETLFPDLEMSSHEFQICNTQYAYQLELNGSATTPVDPTIPLHLQMMTAFAFGRENQYAVVGYNCVRLEWRTKNGTAENILTMIKRNLNENRRLFEPNKQYCIVLSQVIAKSSYFHSGGRSSYSIQNGASVRVMQEIGGNIHFNANGLTRTDAQYKGAYEQIAVTVIKFRRSIFGTIKFNALGVNEGKEEDEIEDEEYDEIQMIDRETEEEEEREKEEEEEEERKKKEQKEEKKEEEKEEEEVRG